MSQYRKPWPTLNLDDTVYSQRPKTSRLVPNPSPDERDSYVIPSPPRVEKPMRCVEMESYVSSESSESSKRRPKTSRQIPNPSPYDRDDYVIRSPRRRFSRPKYALESAKLEKYGPLSTEEIRLASIGKTLILRALLDSLFVTNV